MKLKFTLLLLLPLLNTFSQTVYRHSGDTVYKQTFPNTVHWAKNFSGKADTLSADSNDVKHVAFDGKFVYVWVMQGVTSPAVAFYSSSFHVLDTNGTLLSQRSERYFTDGFYAVGLHPALNGGAWMTYKTLYGSLDAVDILKIDSTGGHDTTASIIDLIGGSNNNIHKLCTMSDSSYFVVGEYWSPLAPTPHTIVCAKFDETGQMIWNLDLAGSSTADFYLSGALTDSMNNSYLIGSFQDIGPLTGVFAIKLDASGQILHKRLFTDQTIPMMSFVDNLSMQDSTLYFLYNDTIIQFDTTFSNDCLNQVSLPVGISGSSLVNGFLGTSNYTPINFHPDTTSYVVIPTNVQVYPLYCFSVGVNEIIEPTFTVGPNPVADQLTIRSSSGIERVTVFNMMGEKVRVTEFGRGVTEGVIEMRGMQNGVYLMVMESDEGGRAIWKVVKE